MSDSVAPATTTAPAAAAPAPAPATSSWEQCSPDRIKDSPTGKRVLLAAKLWNNGREKLQAGDETCVDDFGHAIHLDILGASFFADLVPRNDGGIGDRLQSFLEKAVAEDSPRAPKDRIYALITRAYITFLLTATPQLNMPNKKDGAKIVRLSADLAVKYDPKDPRLLVIRAGFLSQLGGDRSKVSCAVDSRKALELAESEIKEAEKSDLKPEEKSERLAWLRLQKAHANLQLGDLYWSTKPGNPDRNLAETHLKAYVDLATECDPDMHSACYKLAILALWNMTNPKKVPIVPNLVRQYPQKLQPALTMYRRGLAAEEFHRRWLPAGMDEQTGPTARTWLKMVSRALSANPSVKPNPLVPHPGPTCENASCPKTAPKDGEKKGMCSKCLWANYCSRSCQVEHWKAHKAEGCREGRGYSTITADGEFLRE